MASWETHRKRKDGFRNIAAVLILFICILSIGTICLFFGTLPDETSSGIHLIVKSRQNEIAVDRRANSNKLRQGKPTTQKDDNKRPDSPFSIVHSLTTRFMLGQKGQPTLARARYLLFETFCQPTVRYQTALRSGYEFSWFVLADPGLDKEILNDMRNLLSSDGSSSSFPNGNAYLILTDNPSWAADGVGVPNVTSYGAGFTEIARGVRDGTVKLLAGNATRLIQTLEEDIEKRPSKKDADGNKIDLPLLLIETMLDADDGLNNQAITLIQDLAVSYAQQQQKERETDNTNVQPTLNSTWWLLCGTDHIEWHNRDIYRVSEKDYKQNGLSGGIIGLRHAPQYCASAGFTRVGLTMERSNPQSAPMVFPQIAYSNHALATEKFDLCSKTNNNNKNDESAQINGNVTRWSHCFRRDFEGVPFVLKGRTITSDSMDHMTARNEDYRDLSWERKEEHPLLGLNETDKMWGIATKDFSIDRKAAQTTSVYLREHLESIIQENFNSRCAPGFPCREVSEVAFKKMAKNVQRLKKIDKRFWKSKKVENQKTTVNKIIQ